MGLKKIFYDARNNMVINHVKKAYVPEFETDTINRYQMIFSGKVQNVGFRLEFSEMAKRLGLTGYCTNLENGNVLVEVQGPQNKINFIVAFMKTVRRMKIEHVDITALEVDENEMEF